MTLHVGGPSRINVRRADRSRVEFANRYIREPYVPNWLVALATCEFLAIVALLLG